MLNSSKSIFSFLVEIQLRRHEQLSAKDNFVFIGQFKCSLICVVIVGDGFMLVLQQMTVLMFDFSH